MRALLLFVAALFVAMPAHAARKTPSSRASAVALGSGAQSISVDIPAGTTTAAIGFIFANNAVNQAPTSVTIDGKSATKRVSQESAGLMTAIYTATGMATGSGKTLAWTNPSGQNGMDIAVEYRDGTLTYGATDDDECNGCGTLATGSLANSNGDEFLCVYGVNGGVMTSLGSGQSFLDDTSGTSDYGFSTKTTTGSSTTSSFVFNMSFAGFSCVIVTPAAAPSPSFSAGPTYSTTSNTQITATFTANAAGETYYCALYAPGASAPTAAQVAAGTNAHSAVATGSTTGSSEAHAITASDSPTFPKYDPYCVLYNGTTYSSVPTTSTTATTAPTGFQYVTLASVTATGSEPKAYNATNGLITLNYDTQTANFTVGSVLVDATSGAWGYIRIDADSGASGTLTVDKRSGTFADNDTLYDQGGGAALVNGSESAYTLIATSDILVAPLTTTPTGAALTVNTSGQYSYTANGRQYALNALVFHAATNAYLSLPLDAWFNNTAPLGVIPPTQHVVFTNGDAIDFDATAYFQDADNDTLTYARISSLPTGTTFNPTTGHLTGTVSVDATTPVTFLAFDAAGDYATQVVNLIVQTVFSAPDCTSSLTLAQNCAQSVVANTFGSVAVAQSYKCSATIPSGYVISQSPTPGGDMAPASTFSIVASSGNVCSVKSPDCMSIPTTLADCQQLYTTAYSGSVRFATSARCDNTHASGYVISTSPKGGAQTPTTANVSMVSSLGMCSTTSTAMVNCVGQSVAQCNTLVGNVFGANVTIVPTADSCGPNLQSGKIFSQSPAAGKKTKTPATLSVRYCP